MDAPTATVAEGNRARGMFGVIVAIGIGIGLAAGGGSILDGTGTTAGVGEVLLPALVGAIVGVAVGSLVAWPLRMRFSGGDGRDAAVVILVVAGCLGALIAAGSVGELPTAPAAESTRQGDAGSGVAGGEGGALLGLERSDNNLADATGPEVTVVLLVGLAMLVWALWFFAQRFDRVPVDAGVVFLEGREIFADDEEETDVEPIANALERSLDSLLASISPRDSILAAYATLLAELDAVGLGRRPWEGPMEHVRRCLAEARLPAGPIGVLVSLFAEARFGTREMTAADRDAAEGALVESVDLLDRSAAVATGSGE